MQSFFTLPEQVRFALQPPSKLSQLLHTGVWLVLWGLFFTLPAGALVRPGSNQSLVRGSVKDALTGKPLAGARVEVRKRVLEKLPDGTLRLLGLDHSTPLLKKAFTDTQGGFVVPVSTPDCPLVAVEATCPGYLSQHQVMVWTGEQAGSEIIFSLAKAEPTPNETEQLRTLHEQERQGLVFQHPEFSQPEKFPAADSFAQKVPITVPPVKTATGEVFLAVPTHVQVVNLAGFTGLMDFNEFIAGVVSAEMGDGFPFEALKNQAVCARTYALERFNRTGVANGGQAYTATHGNKSTNATYNTNAIVFLFNNQVVPAYFSARCHGDFTLNSEDGLSNITTCIPGGLGVGTLGYARSRPCSGHVNCSQTTETCCIVTIGGRQQFIYGHGVGMCQRGAQQFAGRDGRDWQQIVQAYYTNIVLTNTPGFGVGDQIVTTTGLNVRNSACGATIITNVPSGTTGRIVSGPQRPLCNLAAPDSYLTWWEVEYSNGARGWSVEDFLKKTGTPPTITQFYPIASAPGKTILVSGTGFVAGATQVFFGGSNLVPAAGVSVLSDSQISVQVPASSTGAANINGYLTVRVGSTFEATSQTLPQNVTHPEDPASTFPEFVLWGDVNRNGVFQTNDLSLARAYLLFQATPTASQQLAADVTPLNANGSRGNGQLSSVDFTFLRAVSFGQTSF